MPLPALALGALLAQSAVSAGVNIYNQHEQRKVYQQQYEAYQQQARDFHKNTGKHFAYPALSAPGRAFASRAGLHQSYASTVGSIVHGAFGSGGLYGFVGRGYRRF